MKMFKRIVATIAIVLSLCTIAWGEGNGEVSEKEIQELNKKYEVQKNLFQTLLRYIHQTI